MFVKIDEYDFQTVDNDTIVLNKVSEMLIDVDSITAVMLTESLWNPKGCCRIHLPGYSCIVKKEDYNRLIRPFIKLCDIQTL